MLCAVPSQLAFNVKSAVPVCCAVLSGDDGSDEQELPEEEYDAAMGKSQMFLLIHQVWAVQCCIESVTRRGP
mgnify:FL=1